VPLGHRSSLSNRTDAVDLETTQPAGKVVGKLPAAWEEP
jgi:hypothetical protein